MEWVAAGILRYSGASILSATHHRGGQPDTGAGHIGGHVSKRESLGIKRLHSLHYYVRDLDRMTKLFVDRLDFIEIGRSSAERTAKGRQQSVAFAAGDAVFTFSAPLDDTARAARFLNKHPEGVGTIVFEVADCAHTLKVIESRGGTPITDVETTTDNNGTFRTFSITTPFGDTTFRFVESENYDGLYPGFVKSAPRPDGNQFDISHIDHITSNFPTMSPALLWMEHVLGFERYWTVEFHTDDVAGEREHGSGLKSIVMWDPESGIKFANNEPKRPFFRRSQINVFSEEHRGAGVQHTALVVKDIVSSVQSLRERGIAFMPTPDTYYDALPKRLETSGIGEIEEDIEVLREHGVLVDGDQNKAYMLQIFMKEQAGQFNDPAAGPFFLEIIQRKGDQGFGAGNFRALFESIERQQVADGKVASS